MACSNPAIRIESFLRLAGWCLTWFEVQSLHFQAVGTTWPMWSGRSLLLAPQGSIFHGDSEGDMQRSASLHHVFIPVLLELQW